MEAEYIAAFNVGLLIHEVCRGIKCDAIGCHTTLLRQQWRHSPS